MEGEEVFAQTLSISKEIREINNGLDDLNALESYLRSHTVYDSSIPVPASIRVADVKIPSGINELILKSKIKETLKNTVTPNHPEYRKIENQIKLTKDVLFENIINNKTSYNKMKIKLEGRLSGYNSKLNILPQKEQDLLKIQRNYSIFESNYTLLKQKSYEAGTAIAANVSDVKVIDTAIDLGQGPIYPKPQFNYVVALMLGIIFPLFYIIIKELLDNKIHQVEDIEKRYSIPVLGVIGRNRNSNNLAVFERPKSSVAESFRAIRSNVQFLFKNNPDKTSKTLLLTSSVSGEGKTMVSINMATVFALSGKKTVLIGLDLRKPKIFGDFELKNDVGIVNYLINQKSVEDIITETKIPNLDLILSGPIPPNPSELLLGDNCDKLFDYLNKEYDYIVVDTPPVGLVSDALELFRYADAIAYVVRQNYSEKDMMRMIDDKYRNKEVTNISYIFNDFTLKNK